MVYFDIQMNSTTIFKQNYSNYLASLKFWRKNVIFYLLTFSVFFFDMWECWIGT